MTDQLLRLTGEFTPRGERGPDDVEELVDFINDQLINYWEGCGSLRLETAGQDRPTSSWVICKNDFPFEVAGSEERARERLAELREMKQPEGRTIHYHIHGCPVV